MASKISKIIICVIPAFDKAQLYYLGFSDFELYYLFVRRFRKFGKLQCVKPTIKSLICMRLALSCGFLERKG